MFRGGSGHCPYENEIAKKENKQTSMTEQPKMLVGTDDFKKLLLNSDVFVDKSLLIKGLLEDSGEIILITRPRRWGKTLNMDMVRRFLEIEIDAQGNPLPVEQQNNIKLFTGGEIDLKLATGRKKLLHKLKITDYPDIIAEYQGQFLHLRIYLCFLLRDIGPGDFVQGF